MPGLDFPHGFFVTLSFRIDNVLQAATTDGTLMSQLTSGYVVPAGYEFHAVAVSANSNAARSAGEAVVNITGDGTELVNGPTATLDDTDTQQATGTKRVGVEPIAAGAVVGVSAVGDASWAPATADVDVIVHGVLLPA